MSLITVEPCIYRLKCGALYVKVHRSGINHAGGTHGDIHAARQARAALLRSHHHAGCLHLWRYALGFPMPPSIFVGLPQLNLSK